MEELQKKLRIEELKKTNERMEKYEWKEFFLKKIRMEEW